ncbi:MAG: hypothetical protein V3U98_10855 [Acidobacteriota bacterium]
MEASPSSQNPSPPALPSRLLPLLFFGWAHVSLLTAFGAFALLPHRFSQFFHDPLMLAAVHLVTLGWISASILGSFYVIAPLALRLSLPVRSADYGAFAFLLIGTSSMVWHFWIASTDAMAWAGILVALALGHFAARALRCLGAARIPACVKLHFQLAFANVLAAATLGVLIGFDKQHPFLGGNALSNAYAHAHLAALGWALMMVMGASYRLLPMLLPSAMPKGLNLGAGALLLEVGTLGVCACLLAGSRWLPLFALIASAAIVLFLRNVAWMRQRPRPSPRHLTRPDYGALHALQALGYLGAATALGLILSFAPESEWSFRLVPVYGALGLIGFLSQMVLGVGARILPMFAVLHAVAAAPGSAGFRRHSAWQRPLQAAGFWLWTAGVPVLACGLFWESVSLLAAAGVLLLVALVLQATVTTTCVGRALWARRTAIAPPAPDTPRTFTDASDP